MHRATKWFLALLTSGCPLLLTAASASIGVIRSSGDFEMDGAEVRGNAAVLEGSAVKTAAASSKIRLTDGTLMTISANSRVQVYRDHIVLDQGSQSIRNGRKYHVSAAALTISPMGPQTVAEIASQDSDRVSVAVLKGSVEVRNNAGVLVATVLPGSPMAFDTKPADVAAAGGVVTVGAAAAALAGAAGAAAGISTGLVVAVAAGVAVTGSVVGLDASGTFSASAQAISRP
jgi:hypothetical protein